MPHVKGAVSTRNTFLRASRDNPAGLPSEHWPTPRDPPAAGSAARLPSRASPALPQQKYAERLAHKLRDTLRVPR
jgi:hypothetical protein